MKEEKAGKWSKLFERAAWADILKKRIKIGLNINDENKESMKYQQKISKMKFEDFLKLYYDDVSSRLRENTMKNKRYVIDLKILPYFATKSINSITPADIRRWQNELISKGYSQTYLRTINNQLTAIFNYAVRYYDLEINPCRKAGSMGRSRADEMKFWTKEEFAEFIGGVKDKQKSYITFMTLFWTGMRLGEMLALTPADIDFENKTISISKSYQKIDGRDVITPPKTSRSKRIITVPDFLLRDINDYMNSISPIKSDERLFQVTKHYMEREIKRGIKNSGVKRIRIHDLRHSHCALLFDMGITSLEVAERLGHERVNTTLNIYAHIYPDKQKKLSQKLEKIYWDDIRNKNEK